jgi:Ca-activated chloride channel family protein
MAVANAPTSSAAPSDTPTVPVMVVLDASGSMNQADAPGPRIDAAKAAVTSLIDSLPAQTQVGLQVYGTGTGSTDAEQVAGCTDIKTLIPVGPLDAGAIKAQISAVAASGYTPIGNALRAAADALPDEGPRSIVLVSDGEDTCAPPAPCDVANELHQRGIDLVIHTVGFKVDATAREQLSCVAQATGGTYSDAVDATQLTQALATKVDYAITGYTTAGTPVSGADQPSAQAPLLAPGQYVDTFDIGGSSGLDSAGTTKYYTIPVQNGARPYISVTIVPPERNTGSVEIFGIDLDLMRADGESCTSERGAVVLSGGRNETATAVIDGPTFGAAETTSYCPTDGVAVLEIARIGQAWADLPLQVEIVVRMEPPADASGLLPQASQGDPLPAPTHGTPTALTGGTGFNDAPRLTSNATYQDTVATGQSRFYRVPQQWGQRFSYLVTEVGPAQPSLGIVGSLVWVDLFNPVRSVVTGSVETTGRLWYSNDPSEPFSGDTPYPVRYTNRKGVEQRGFSLDGDYYLRVNADRNEDEPSSTTYLITVVVSGDPEPGPDYQLTGTPTSNNPSSAPLTSAPGGSGVAPTMASVTAASSNNAAPGTPTAGLTGQATPITESGTSGWVWVVIAGLAALAVAVLFLARFRRRPPGSPSTGGPDQFGDQR